MRSARVRVTVRGFMGLAAVVAVAGALFVQEHRHARREAELRRQLAIARALPLAQERMRTLLGDMGVVIVGGASGAEVLRVTGGYQGPTRGFPVTGTGEVLGAPFARGLAGSLLDVRNYIYIGAGDFSLPKFGVRLRRGEESVDILFSLEAGHTDVWAFQRDERGEIVHGGEGYVCINDGALERLLRASLVR